jgi:large conductance mechanosensitive channel
MVKELRDFLFRGNVLDLAVAVLIGAAFGALIASFTENILTPLIAAIIGTPTDFAQLGVTVRGSTIAYGLFLNALVSFLLVGTALFVVLKVAQKANPPAPEPEASPAPETDEARLLREIRDLLAARR